MLNKSQKIFILFIFLGVLFIALEPSVREKVTFAVTYFDPPKTQTEALNISGNLLLEEKDADIPVEKSHAPEPTTMFLFLGGVGGILLRFAQRSFEKFKRVSDMFLSVLGLTVFLPILGISAVFIKLTSRGPVIYKQDRVGRNGRIFKIYKLRTMRVDAEKETGPVWAKEDDPRVTPVGRFLRKTHIDEIPQLLNVVKGQMSIVGPRPERPEMVRDLKELVLDYEKRLAVKPGITGLAQIWHKYDETLGDVKKKIKYDILYIKKMCLLVDLRIMANTFIVALSGKGAR